MVLFGVGRPSDTQFKCSWWPSMTVAFFSWPFAKSRGISAASVKVYTHVKEIQQLISDTEIYFLFENIL